MSLWWAPRWLQAKAAKWSRHRPWQPSHSSQSDNTVTSVVCACLSNKERSVFLSFSNSPSLLPSLLFVLEVMALSALAASSRVVSRQFVPLVMSRSMLGTQRSFVSVTTTQSAVRAWSLVGQPSFVQSRSCRLMVVSRPFSQYSHKQKEKSELQVWLALLSVGLSPCSRLTLACFFLSFSTWHRS